MKSHVRSRLIRAVLPSLLGLTLVVAGCSGQAQTVASSDADSKTVTFGYVPWDECVASTFLWKELLERQDYTVNLTQLEPAALYAGVAQGDVDFFTCGVPKTHADYWERFGEDFDTVGQWYDTLIQGFAVPDYVQAESIADLAGRADEFGGQIVGIESGSGLMRDAHGSATEDYDLSGYNIIDGSTPAMLAALQKALNAQEPIVVALWQPHWAFSEYPIHLLSDPEKSFGENDTYRVIASKDASQNTQLVDQLATFHMTPDQLQSLELEITNAGTGNEQDAVRTWIGENEAAVAEWTQDS